MGCSVSSSSSWVTASLWGLGTRRFDIPHSPSATSWDARVSMLPQEGTGEGPGQKRVTVPLLPEWTHKERIMTAVLHR